MYAALLQLLYLWTWRGKEVGRLKVIIWREAEVEGGKPQSQRMRGGGNFYGSVDPRLFYQNYQPITASFGVKRVT